MTFALVFVTAAAGGFFAEQGRWGFAIAAGILAALGVALSRKDA